VLRERWGSILKPHFKTPGNACVSLHRDRRDLERKERRKRKKREEKGRERRGQKEKRKIRIADRKEIEKEGV
jgi:hypothetical protein